MIIAVCLQGWISQHLQFYTEGFLHSENHKSYTHAEHVVICIYVRFLTFQVNFEPSNYGIHWHDLYLCGNKSMRILWDFYFLYTHTNHQINIGITHDDVIKWKHFPRYWPFVRGIHRSPVNSPHKGQRRGALMFSLICARINGWVNSGEAGDLRRHHTHYGITIMIQDGEILGLYVPL